MLKLLILDDEKIIMEAIYQFILKNRVNEYEVFCANDSAHALSIMEDKRIDILVSDIEMPDISGLELHKKISQLYPMCHTIFFTAFPKFDYAHYSNKYNIRLVLKSEGFDTLLSTIDSVSLKIHNDLIVSNINYLQSNSDHIIEKLQSPLVEEGMILRNLKEINPSFDENLPSYFVLCHFNQHTSNGIHPKMLSIIRIFTNYFKKFYEIYYTITSYDDVLFCFQNKAEKDISSFDEAMKHIDNTIELLHTSLCEISETSVSIAVSEKFVSVQEIYFQYGLLKETLESNRDENGVICKIHSEEESERKLLLLTQRIIQAMLKKDNASVDHHLSELISLCNKQQAPLESIKLNVNYIISTYIEKNMLWNNKQISQKINILLSAPLEDLSYEFLSEMLHAIVAASETSSDYLTTDKTVVLEIDRFIQNNYQNDISLSDIAKHVFLSPNYISRVYKQEKHQNIVSRIQEVRLQKALILLTGTNMKISDISNSVGFSSPRYFNTLFKKWKGITPLEYRQENI